MGGSVNSPIYLGLHPPALNACDVILLYFYSKFCVWWDDKFCYVWPEERWRRREWLAFLSSSPQHWYFLYDSTKLCIHNNLHVEHPNMSIVYYLRCTNSKMPPKEGKKPSKTNNPEAAASSPSFPLVEEEQQPLTANVAVMTPWTRLFVKLFRK